MATPNSKKSEKKTSFFGGIFGGANRRTGKNSLVNFDYIKGVEAIEYRRKSDGTVKQQIVEKNSYQSYKAQYFRGHRFELYHKPTFCDICQELSWGLYAQSARCCFCRCTCHLKCVNAVSLDCPKAPSIEKSFDEITKEVQEILSFQEGYEHVSVQNNNLPSFVSSISHLRKLIEEFNSHSPVIMTLHNDGTFDGFIRVHMNLNRPVNVSADVSNLTLRKAVAAKRLSDSRRPLSEIFKPDNSDHDSDVYLTPNVSHGNELSVLERRNTKPARRLSFYMPRGTYKPLHVTSTTTALEVISALLTKYNVTDNPKKFALYEKHVPAGDKNNKEATFRRLRGDENPLLLRLNWGALNTTDSFVLKEDDEGPIQWTNFELPELANFLEILQIEEDALLAQIYKRFELYKQSLQKAIELKDRIV
ncbi:ras association domain-containing protein 1 isoform X3 [Hydra vulgaris]|uniref:Ras association domain-containing protein 1 isoform X3 n=1 Tax=Hydra vulgaris TaxID=6087 RepID=A0ABM4D8Q3_HYDVU